MNLPEKTSEIFETLSRANFICSDSIDEHTRNLYDIINNNENTLKEYFEGINFVLERGNEYFYFSRKEAKINIENKMATAEKWIDFIDFLKAYDDNFTSGYRFYPREIVTKIHLDIGLKDKLDNLKKYNSTDTKSYEDKINELTKTLEKEGFVELENVINNQYKVVAAFKYIEQLVLSINIPDEMAKEL